MIHPAAKFQFGRVVHEYARWQAVEEADRSRAPAWWWDSGLALRDDRDPLPQDWSGIFGLANGATYGDAARRLLSAIADQTTLPWPEEFPRRYQPAS